MIGDWFVLRGVCDLVGVWLVVLIDYLCCWICR